MTPDSAIAFLEESARYFEKRPTGGEDAAHWSNVMNAENCRKIAAMLKSGKARPGCVLGAPRDACDFYCGCQDSPPKGLT